jgi:hypothetical protein
LSVFGTRPTDTIRRRLPASGLAVLVGVGDGDALLAGLDFADLHAQLDLQALLGQQLLRFLGHAFVGGAQECGQRFEHGHVGAQAAPHRAHFQADHAGADHAQLLRHGANAARLRCR